MGPRRRIGVERNAAAAALALIVIGAGGASPPQAGMKAPDVQTLGAPVVLGAEQRAAIAAKDALRMASPTTPVSPPAKGSAPTTGVVSTSVVADVNRDAITAACTAKSEWPQVSPSLGTVPRPEWRNPPGVRKPPDVTVSRPRPGTSPGTGSQP